MLKPGNLLLYCELILLWRTSKHSDQFSYLFKKILKKRTSYFIKHSLWLLMKSKQRHVTKSESKASLFSICFCAFVLFQYDYFYLSQIYETFSIFLYNDSNRSSRQLITKQINCNETRLFLTGEIFVFLQAIFIFQQLYLGAAIK